MDKNIINELKKLGLVEKDKDLYLSKTLDNELKLEVIINSKGELREKVIDENEEIYDLYKVLSASGEFVSSVRENVNRELEPIIAILTNKDSISYSGQKKEIIEFIKETYLDRPEYLWESSPMTFVFRNNINNKWYGLVTKIPANKLGIKRDGDIEIINLKGDPKEIDHMIDKINFFPAWHMNKKHWFTIVLDNLLSTNDIKEYIKKSYDLVTPKRKDASK